MNEDVVVDLGEAQRGGLYFFEDGPICVEMLNNWNALSALMPREFRIREASGRTFDCELLFDLRQRKSMG